MLPDERRRQIEDLFRLYGRGVGSYVMARVANADVAEAITSNVFMIVVRRIEQCRSSPTAWLWSIVRSELARHFRQHRATVELQDKFIDPAELPPEVAARKEMQERMRIALHRLSEEQQRIVYLKFFLDVSNTEIAAELGLSASNVGVIIHRAMKELREMMENGSGKPEARSRNKKPGASPVLTSQIDAQASASLGKPKRSQTMGPFVILIITGSWFLHSSEFLLASGSWLPATSQTHSTSN